MAVGLFCLISLPKHFRRAFSNAGAALLKVTAQGLEHSPRINGQAIPYSWEQIAAVYYAEVFVENGENGALFHKSQLIVIFDRAKLPAGATADEDTQETEPKTLWDLVERVRRIDPHQGDRLRLRIENRLPQDTTINWHGVRVPSAMDGAPYVSHPPIRPGDRRVRTFRRGSAW